MKHAAPAAAAAATKSATAATVALSPPRSAHALAAVERRELEASFGRDLGHVRVHDGPSAAASARAIDAAAYTIGHDVVLGAEAPARGTAAGRRLLAHEIAHTLQQQPLVPGTPVAPGARGTVHERAADRAAERATRGEPAQLDLTARLAPVIQRAEAGTYVSTTGSDEMPAYLNAAAAFYRFWGHPNVVRVGSMESVVDDLDKTQGHLDTFRIVSHGVAGELWLGLLNGMTADRFDKDFAALRSATEFRALAAQVVIIDSTTFASWTADLLKDATTQPLLAAIGVTAVPAADSVAGLFLRGVLEHYYLSIVVGPDGKPAKLRNRAAVEAFTNLRRTLYAQVLIDAVPNATAKAVLKKAIGALVAAAPTALTAANNTASLAAGDEVDSMIDKSGALVPEVDRETREGAGGPYVTKLARLRDRIDSTTHIELRGCHVGADTGFLDTMRNLFGRPGNLPSISAPDLYQYFFKLGDAQMFGTNAQEQARLATDFTAVASTFDARQRRKHGEAMRAVEEKSLGEFARRYGLDPLKVYLLNPELRDPTAWIGGAPRVVWLVARKVKAGTSKTMESFASGLGDIALAPVLRSYNPQIKRPPPTTQPPVDELTPTTEIWLCPADLHTTTPADLKVDPKTPPGGPAPPVPLRGATKSPDQTATDYETSLRAGEVFIFVDQAQVKIRLDLAKGSGALATWLAARNWGPTPVTAASLAAKTALPQQLNISVEFMSKDYPANNVVDPLFSDDPRYAPHIIRRP